MGNRNVEAHTTATQAQARAQMAHLLSSQVDWSKLETGGNGAMYIKVWRDKPLALYLWFFFEPTADGERIAYERAVQAMIDNPGARWAVSGQCGYACAGLPRLWNDSMGHAFAEYSWAALEELYVRKSRGLVVEKHNADEYLALADLCYAFEVEPSKWRITSKGEEFVEARRKAPAEQFAAA